MTLSYYEELQQNIDILLFNKILSLEDYVIMFYYQNVYQK